MRSTLLLSLMFLLLACSKTEKEKTTDSSQTTASTKPVSKYPEHVGDIAFDATLDDPDFKTCQNIIPQYYALGADFRVDNDVLMSHFESVEINKNQSLTYHTIRFIVNCKGETGRYRTETMSGGYQPANLDFAVAENILERLKSFDQWPEGRDFYQYLTFKIEGGRIKEVLP